MDTKKCVKCGQTKPSAEFFNRTSGLSSWCKKCCEEHFFAFTENHGANLIFCKKCKQYLSESKFRNGAKICRKCEFVIEGYLWRAILKKKKRCLICGKSKSLCDYHFSSVPLHPKTITYYRRGHHISKYELLYCGMNGDSYRSILFADHPQHYFDIVCNDCREYFSEEIQFALNQKNAGNKVDRKLIAFLAQRRIAKKLLTECREKKQILSLKKGQKR